MRQAVILFFVGCLVVGNLYAQSDQYVTVQITVDSVYSNAYDGTDKRHEWRFQAALNNEAYGTAHARGEYSEDRGIWWPWNFNILEAKTEKTVPHKIRIKFWAFEDESGKKRRHERDDEFEIPLNFSEGKDKRVIIKLDTITYA